VQPPKTPKPAPARHGKPVSKVEQLGGRLFPSNNPNATRPQARPLPDDSGEGDLEFFRARPGINSRNRLVFDGEPPAALLERDDESEIAFIRVQLERDADGKPATILREIIFGEWGRA
jgi:hypothetical protein